MYLYVLTVHHSLALSLVSEEFSSLSAAIPSLHRYNCLQLSDRPDCFARRVEGVSLEELHVLLDTNKQKKNTQKFDKLYV